MPRILAVLTLILGFLPLAVQPASAAVALHLENHASGSAAVAEHLVGQNTRLSEEAVRENITPRYDLASDSPVAARGAVTISREGLQTVTAHPAQFGEHAPNRAMIDRLAAQLGSKVSGADANFYTHELLRRNTWHRV
jgi:hypothetical protein